MILDGRIDQSKVPTISGRSSRRQFLLGSVATILVSRKLSAEEVPKSDPAPASATPPIPALTFSEQLLHTTVLVRCNDIFKPGAVSSGTGFLFSLFNFGGQQVPTLVTNKHVLLDNRTGFCATKCEIVLTKTVNGRPEFREHISEQLPGYVSWIPHPDPKVDLILYPMGEHFKRWEKDHENVFVRFLDRSLIPTDEEIRALVPVEDLLIVGYPAGISDTVNNVPVLRRGITATPAYLDFEGRQEFLIDAPIVHDLFSKGASVDERSNSLKGSYNKFVGIVFGSYEMSTNGKMEAVPAPTGLQETPVIPVPIQLGSCIKSSRLHEFEPHMIEKGLYEAPSGYVLHNRNPG
jgi:hypothetical protein